MKLDFNAFSTKLREKKAITLDGNGLTLNVLYPKVFSMNPQCQTLLFPTLSDFFNLEFALTKDEQILTKSERFFLGLCYLAIGDTEEMLNYLTHQEMTDYTEALTALGEYYLENGDVDQGISYFEKAAPKQNLIYHYLGCHYLFGLNNVKQDDKKAQSCYEKLGGTCYNTRDQKIPSTLLCKNQVRTNLRLKEIVSCVEKELSLMDANEPNALLKTLRTRLESELKTFQDAMKTVPFASTENITAKFFWNEDAPVSLTDEQKIHNKQNKIINQFVATCRNETNKTIRLLDKNELKASDYCLNLLKAIMNAVIRVFTLGLANNNTLFSYTHAKSAQKIDTLQKSLSINY